MMDEDRVFELAQRIATLEAHHDQYLVDRQACDAEIQALADTVASTSISVNNLVNKITSWEGKFGSFIFIVGCIWTFLAAAWSSIVEFLKFKIGAS